MKRCIMDSYGSGYSVVSCERSKTSGLYNRRGNFLTSWETISFSKTLFHRVNYITLCTVQFQNNFPENVLCAIGYKQSLKLQSPTREVRQLIGLCTAKQQRHVVRQLYHNFWHNNYATTKQLLYVYMIVLPLNIFDQVLQVKIPNSHQPN